MKKHILWIGGLLVVGALANTILSWVCARWVDQSIRPRETVEAEPRVTNLWHQLRPPGFPRGVSWFDERVGFGTRTMILYTHDPELSGVTYVGAITFSGWPASAFRGSMWIRVDLSAPRARFSDRLVRNAIPYEPGPNQARARLVPLRPMWIGFVINTTLYGTLLWVLIPGRLALKRLLRRRRGHCESCGFDLQESPTGVCSECGAPANLATADHGPDVLPRAEAVPQDLDRPDSPTQGAGTRERLAQVGHGGPDT